MTQVLLAICQSQEALSRHHHHQGTMTLTRRRMTVRKAMRCLRLNVIGTSFSTVTTLVSDDSDDHPLAHNGLISRKIILHNSINFQIDD